MKPKKEFLLNPNCSEVIFRPSEDMTRRQLVRALKEIGIHEVDILGYYSWEPNEKVKMLLDVDNPNIPDFENHATLDISQRDPEDEEPYEVRIVGSQHCQHQLFKTMRKIEKSVRGSWEGYDGGTTADYENWIEDGEPVVEDYQKKHKEKRDDLLRILYNREHPEGQKEHPEDFMEVKK